MSYPTPPTGLHPSTFEYLKPTEKQLIEMVVLRTAAAQYARTLGDILTNGPDKTYALRKLREIAIWANVAVTREADGTLREP